MRWPLPIGRWGALMAVIWLGSAMVHSAEKPKALPEIDLQGRVVCLSEEMQRLYETELPSKHAHVYGFKTADGGYYTLIRNRFSEGLFSDETLRKRELILHGRVLPKTQIFEVTGGMREVRNGKLYELYYWCDICSIKSVAPGQCMCCQQPVELREREIGPGAKTDY